jgi:Smg protein
MNDNVFDILIYLFEHLDPDVVQMGPTQELHKELEHAGFAEGGIHRALTWLEGLSEATSQTQPQRAPSIHLYSAQELARLSTEVRGYLLHLEQIGILTPLQRELVLDRLCALGVDDVAIDEVQWIVLIVLSSQPTEEEALARMEELMFEDVNELRH